MRHRMIRPFSIRALGLVLALCCLRTEAQTATVDRNTVVIDPAHGGTDDGAFLSGHREKDLTLALGIRLRSLLMEKGFQVAMTREADMNPGEPSTRAEFANRYHAVACLVVHASASTSGVSIATSALGSALMKASDGSGPNSSGPVGVVPWNRAQETYSALSSRLANQVGTAIQRSGTPVTIVHAVVHPLDNLTCPALSVELGGLRVRGVDLPEAHDAQVLQRIAEAIADTLGQWRSRAVWDGSR